MRKIIDNLEFFPGVHFANKNLFNSNRTKHLLIFDKSFEEMCSLKAFVDVSLAGKIMDWVLFTLNTICFIKTNLGEKLSSRTRALVSSNLPVM